MSYSTHQEAVDLINKIRAKVDQVSAEGKIYKLDTQMVAMKIQGLLSQNDCKIEGKYTLTREQAIKILEDLILNPQIEKFELKVSSETIFIMNNKEELI